MTQGYVLEVGAGAGSIARFMRAEVGPTGRVVAVDTNPRFLVELDGVEIVTGDVQKLGRAKVCAEGYSNELRGNSCVGAFDEGGSRLCGGGGRVWLRGSIRPTAGGH